MLAKVSNALLLVMAGKALFLLLVMAMMADKASAGGLSLTLGFSAGLPQPQDCPRFLDSLEVGTSFSNPFTEMSHIFFCIKICCIKSI